MEEESQQLHWPLPYIHCIIEHMYTHINKEKNKNQNIDSKEKQYQCPKKNKMKYLFPWLHITQGREISSGKVKGGRDTTLKTVIMK
jgi:hypothetical protein